MSEPITMYWAEVETGFISQDFDFSHGDGHGDAHGVYPKAYFELQNKKGSWLVLFILSPTARIKIGWAPSSDEAKEKALLSFDIINQSFKVGVEVGKKIPNDTPEYY